ncbi:MAG: hypothetical protein M9962_06120 [Oligoflexia bacterium]|nr:hypothetical protein [Oligoflexia bacterium]
MSVQKLLAEAEKLLEKGKHQEAISKLNSALSIDKLNQIVATKLAGAYLELGNQKEAAKVYIDLASRLTDEGRAKIAIAIFKQAMDLSPDDIEIRVKYALGCESVGKNGDALQSAQIALKYFLKRKKYFDAAGLMPLINRLQPNVEAYKLAWIEILELAQAERMVIDMLVSMCGPPGLVSNEISVGGEPAELSLDCYEKLKRLVAFFPKNSQLPYAVAWCAYRNDKKYDFYFFLKECLRRNPDSCLALLLFCRNLAESEKLNEALFVYQFLKSNMATDKSVDLLTLSKLVDAFVEKNGWISFTEGMGEALDAQGFRKAFLQDAGTSSEAFEAENKEEEKPEKIENKEESIEEEGSYEPPAEIELGLPESNDDSSEMELQLSNTQNVSSPKVPKKQKVEEVKPVESKAKEEKQEPQILKEEKQNSSEESLRQTENTVELTALIKPEELQSTIDSNEVVQEQVKASVVEKGEDQKSEKPKNTFNPLEGISDEEIAKINNPPPLSEDKTQMFSPVEIINASNAKVESVETKSIFIDQLEQNESAVDGKSELFDSSAKELEELKSASAEGQATQVFSPMESIEAVGKSRKPTISFDESDQQTQMVNLEKQEKDERFTDMSVMVNEETNMASINQVSKFKSEHLDASDVPIEESTVVGKVEDFLADTSPEPQAEVDDATRIGDLSEFSLQKPIVQEENIVSESAAISTKEKSNEPLSPIDLVFNNKQLPEKPFLQSKNSNEEQPLLAQFENKEEIKSQEVEEEIKKKVAFVPIPTLSSEPKKQEIIQEDLNKPNDEVIDLGDDLLEDSTRDLVQSTRGAGTTQLYHDIKSDLSDKNKDKEIDSEYLLKKADRYLAKRNYYLARKLLRFALLKGGDESFIREKLREIRKLELPSGMYASSSSDEITTGSKEILEKLEHDFDLNLDIDEAMQKTASELDFSIDQVWKTIDSQTVLDFAVGLYEMGLYEKMEELTQRAINEGMVDSFKAYYLLAMGKIANNDYPGAISILKRLSKDLSKSEEEKISIYYSLGEVFEKTNQNKRSQSFYQKVAQIDSNYRNIKNKKISD